MDLNDDKKPEGEPEGEAVRDTLERAYEAAEALEAGKTAPEPAAAPEPTEPALEPTEPTLAPEPAAPEPAKEPEPANQPTDKFSVDSPEDWPQAAREMYQSLPPEAQTFLVSRYKEMQAGFTRSMQEAAETRKSAQAQAAELGEVGKTIQGWKPYMDSRGMNPAAAFDEAIRFENVLANGTMQQKRDVLLHLAHRYGITAHDSAPAGGNPGQPQYPANQVNQPNPQQMIQQAVHQAVAPIHAQMQNNLTEQKASEINKTLEQLRSETSKDGKPLRPYWDEVQADMTALANSAMAVGKPIPDPRELYETAIWANPTTRNALLAQRNRAAKGNNAIRTSIGHGTGSPAIPSEPSKGPVRDTLNRLMDEAGYK